MSVEQNTTIEQITSADGAQVTVHSCGTGPGIVILHGAGVTVRDYGRLAKRLSVSSTVHRYNRRGRSDSAPLSGGETAQTDLDDLAAVLEHTGTRQIFGHSGGGFVAMQAGLSLPVERVAVYDPAVAITGVDFPRDFLEPFDQALAEGDVPLAFALMGSDINPETATAKLPIGMQKLIVRGFLRTPWGKQMVELLPTIGPEIRRILDHEWPASDFTGITGEVLLAYGTRSSRYFADICVALGGAIPKATVLPIRKASHNSANIARPGFVEPFTAFFAGVTPAAATTGEQAPA